MTWILNKLQLFIEIQRENKPLYLFSAFYYESCLLQSTCTKMLFSTFENIFCDFIPTGFILPFRIFSKPNPSLTILITLWFVPFVSICCTSPTKLSRANTFFVSPAFDDWAAKILWTLPVQCVAKELYIVNHKEVRVKGHTHKATRLIQVNRSKYLYQ